ncbi:CopG family transcriptional regulator [Brasilonema octagenarum UFV-E1]|uniref:CopG family transcriptional regulator n=3 Tax=Scytonemataceae TaxID=1182 RepID=A0A856MPL4_9CYAN|nr:CopG family transcriptional regulator [Brasilonema octagenarum UFV-OR1]QDL11491.1 CopG family transcriptional regulator [Brasilonema sennae CENA114]QDL17874.1 CopG family transcriptional regulator [Brasilonema octagenarum UFV-E1]
MNFEMGGKTLLSGVTTYISPELKAELEAWAQEEERSISWLLAKLIENKLQERRQKVSQALIAGNQD